MKDYLSAQVGKRLLVIREGYPDEVHLIGTIVRVEGEVVILKSDEDAETAVPLSRILSVGPPKSAPSAPAGFL